MRKLNILNLATTDQGGAGAASLSFNELFNREGHYSRLLVKQSKFKNKDVIVLKNNTKFSPNRILSRLKYEWKNLINKRYKNGLYDSKYSFFNEDESKQHISSKKILDNISFKPDVIVLHWISNFVNSKTINELAKATNAKIVWLLMDNAPLTGGCHYPWDCKGFCNDCNDCPAIIAPDKKIIAKKNLAYKHTHIPTNLEILTCTEFDYSRAITASVFANHKIHKILLPIDDTIFITGDKIAAKKHFGIAPEVKVILFGSSKVNNIRKGGIYFLEAIKKLQSVIIQDGKSLDEFLILSIGKVDRKYFEGIEISVLHSGFLDLNSLIIAYQAADVFVSPSIEDSGPLMISQSIMCGTPVVAFEMGLAIDLVIPNKTGYRAKLRNGSDLAKGIKYILELNKEEKIKMSENCRNLGLERCHSTIQRRKFIEIFKLEK
jgi:glycosyltransferase involved in cell wall biosynthesis